MGRFVMNTYLTTLYSSQRFHPKCFPSAQVLSHLAPQIEEQHGINPSASELHLVKIIMIILRKS